MSLPSNIHEVPLFRLIIPLSAGIILQVFLNIIPANPEAIIIPIASFAMLILAHFLFQQWQFKWVFGAALNIFLLTCGLYLAIDFSYDKNLKSNNEYRVIVRLLDEPNQRVRSIRAKCQITQVYTNKQFRSSNEKMLLYFNCTDSLASTLKYGDIIATTITTQEFNNPTNPYQFNIKKYMKQEGIRYSSYISSNSWTLCGSKTNWIVLKSLKMRDNLIELFKRFNIEGQELAVVSALTIGYRELLDDEIQKVYSATGAMHILSVSGLHVGILYFLLVFILGYFPKNKYSAPIKVIVSLLFLWFFALLTGLSPSVCRSALMFSMVAVGQGFNYRTNIINTLATAAFILLVANPYNLLNTGFQLSFLAVISIVIFYPSIYSWLYFKNKIVNYVWSLIAVSIAAQIGTFPLTAAYFAQFPNYFIITNLIAIPLSTLILYMSVFLLIASPIQFIAQWIGKGLNLLLVLLNGGLEWIEGIPFSITSAIHISTIQVFALVFALIIIAVFIQNRKAIYLQSILAFIIVVLLITIQHKVDISKTEFIIFDTPKKTCIGLRENGTVNFIKLDTASSDPIKELGFYLSGYINHETMNGVYQYQSINTDINSANSHFKLRKKGGIALITHNNFIAAIPYNDSTKNLQATSPISVDIILVNKYYSTNLTKYITPKTAIVESSIPKWKMDKFLLHFTEQRINIYNLNSSGAFQLRVK